MPEMTSKVKFFETSSGSLQWGDGQRSGYPAPLQKNKKNLRICVMHATCQYKIEISNCCSNN